MASKAEVDVLFHCFYMQMRVEGGHPILSVRWPLTPMPEPEVGDIYGGLTFNLGSTNTVLVRDNGLNIIVDPGIIQLGRYGAFAKRLSEFNLRPDDTDVVVNTHCHYDHVESNYLFRGRLLVIHERELEYCRQLNWPEFAGAFMGIMKVDTISGPKRLSEHVRVIETFGHTPGSISVLAEAEDGLVACIGDAAIVRENYTEFRAPSVVTVNIAPEVSVASLKRVAALDPSWSSRGTTPPSIREAEKGL